MNKVVLTLLLVLFLPLNAALAETWRDKVSFKVPPTWRLLTSKDTGTVVAKLYLIRKDLVGSETHASNAVLQYYAVPSSVTLAEADRIVASHVKGATLILSAEEGPLWKTYLFFNYERKQEYVVLCRIGIADGVAVELTLALPILGDKSQAPLSMLTLNEDFVKGQMAGIYCHRSSVEAMVAAFNFICENLKIANNNKYKADVRIIEPPANGKVYRYTGEDKKDD